MISDVSAVPNSSYCLTSNSKEIVNEYVTDRASLLQDYINKRPTSANIQTCITYTHKFFNFPNDRFSISHANVVALANYLFQGSRPTTSVENLAIDNAFNKSLTLLPTRANRL